VQKLLAEVWEVKQEGRVWDRPLSRDEYRGNEHSVIYMSAIGSGSIQYVSCAMWRPPHVPCADADAYIRELFDVRGVMHERAHHKGLCEGVC
jgi:hypothetical protein